MVPYVTSDTLCKPMVPYVTSGRTFIMSALSKHSPVHLNSIYFSKDLTKPDWYFEFRMVEEKLPINRQTCMLFHCYSSSITFLSPYVSWNVDIIL